MRCCWDADEPLLSAPAMIPSRTPVLLGIFYRARKLGAVDGGYPTAPDLREVSRRAIALLPISGHLPEVCSGLSCATSTELAKLSKIVRILI